MKNALIIDKERAIRKALTLFLIRKGYKTYSAETVSQAQKLMDNTSFDTIIADVSITDENAVRFYGEMNRLEEVNYIFTSAFPEEMPLSDSSRIKEAYFLEKPFSLNRLSELLTPQYGEDLALAV